MPAAHTEPTPTFGRRISFHPRELWAGACAKGIHLLVALLSISLLVVFGFIVEEMLEGETTRIDSAILLAFRVPGHLGTPIGPRWLQQSAIDISALGGFTFIWLFTIVVAGFFALTRRWRAMLIFLAAIGGASLLDSLLKVSFHRARPEIVPHLTYVTNASFPSGHAMISAATYLTVGAMLARTQPSMRVRVYLLGVFIAVTLLIGISRLYLGVHWPSDVFAGWSVGAAWALIFWIIAERGPAAKPEEDPAAEI
ncbi:MAG: phosphoesterase PA-phosphatase related [Caulobacteraceae bacterium]|jgi:undecaprenyl-diphosphatase|nr:phosphoesterase PA-phosphatase related [Caulobacteraceae bacterium]